MYRNSDGTASFISKIRSKGREARLPPNSVAFVHEAFLIVVELELNLFKQIQAVEHRNAVQRHGDITSLAH